MSEREIFVKDTHRGPLVQKDGVLTKVLGAGRSELPKAETLSRASAYHLGLKRIPKSRVPPPWSTCALAS